MDMPDISGITSGLGDIFQDLIPTLIIILNIPLWITWIALSFFLFYVFVLQRIAIIMPWDYKHMITKIVPTAEKTIRVLQDRGGYANEGGSIRFKLKNEGIIMQKPDSSDIYRNGEILVISLSASKKFYAKRKIAYESKKIIFETGDPTISQVNFYEMTQRNNSLWFEKSFDKYILLIVCWVSITIMLSVSNLLIYLPVAIKAVYS